MQIDQTMIQHKTFPFLFSRSRRGLRQPSGRARIGPGVSLDGGSPVPLSARRCFQREGKAGRLSTKQFGHSNVKKYDLSYHGFPIFATKNVFKICEIITILDLFLYISLYISHLFHIGGPVISEYLFIFCTVFRHSIFFPKSRKIQAVFAPRPKVPLPENVFIKGVHFPHFRRTGPARGNIARASLCFRENLPFLNFSAYLCAATDHRCQG